MTEGSVGLLCGGDDPVHVDMCDDFSPSFLSARPIPQPGQQSFGLPPGSLQW